MNDLPPNKEIPVGILSSVLNDTTNSYKYYWFLAILDIVQTSDSNEIRIDDLCEKMIESVWYPLNFFKLSFGAQDSFKKIADSIHAIVDLEHSDASVYQQINEKTDENTRKQIKSDVNKLARWVPYRFIRPFFKNELMGVADHRINALIKKLSAEYSRQNPNLVPYYFQDDKIVINLPWKEYLLQHIGLIKGFIYWKLVNFVQKNNPNVLGISAKLFKPEKRNLELNNKSWDFYLNHKKGMKCIYSKDQLPKNFSLDHFVPWSYTVHDYNWNIVPVSKEINSGKSNNLPSMDHYLEDFVALQNDFYVCIYDSNFKLKNNIMEHYCLLFNEMASDIYQMDKPTFGTKLTNTIQPMVQIATNMGFNRDWVYKRINTDKIVISRS